MKEIARQLDAIVATAEPRLQLLNDENSGPGPLPNAWSKKEILGHLIDSAANNHQRIVRAICGVAVDFPVYDQNQWVTIQRYNDISWSALVNFWVAYNKHLSHVIHHTPQDAEFSPCNVGKAEPVTLAELVKDYLRHMRHHLNDLID